jgi:hypothetical protein
MSDPTERKFSSSNEALAALLVGTVLAMLGLGAALALGSWALAGISVGSWTALLVAIAIIGMVVDKKR